MPDLLIGAFWLWTAGALLALARLNTPARRLIALGAAAAISACAAALPHGSGSQALPIGLAGEPVTLQYAPEALWLLGFGLLPGALAVALGTPVRGASCGWLLGAALSLIGALGIFGVQDAYALLIAWELLSLGGAVMILSERTTPEAGRRALYMLALLEVGTVAILLALLLLAQHAGGAVDFGTFRLDGSTLGAGARVFIGLLALVGFGAKLGLLPFYEWFPGAYGNASGATGALLSGVVLNAAFFALSRTLMDWLAAGPGLHTLGVIVTAVGVLTSVLAALYAFQQDDWRRLLAFSTAENAAIAVTSLGASLLFRASGENALSGLAWTVAVLHLAGHALAKGGLFLTADGVYVAAGSYRLSQRGWLRSAGLMFGIGALFAAMSLAAMPPQIGFVTEWFTFQTLFQGFHLATLGGRLTLALAGAGIALTAAVALATFIKAFGIGLLGDGRYGQSPSISPRYGAAVFILGLAVLIAAVGMPLWLHGLDYADLTQFGANSAQAMTTGWLLVPLTDTFAFISPSLLSIVMPLLALLPLCLLLAARSRPVRRTPVWYGGLREDPQRSATTALTFSNATRTFYSFIYRPTLDAAREHRATRYFVHRLEVRQDVTDVFGPVLFDPIRRAVWRLAGRLRALQSGDLNFYLGLIGGLLIVILALTLR
jgi:formate hydrogenlyase subunit 3/multisubunit Na+/H+ antiporter MnhD subunit